MTERLLLVSTVGTSILRHGADRSVHELLNRTANDREEEISPDSRAVIEQCAQAARQAMQDPAGAMKWSAELNGALRFLQTWRSKHPRTVVNHLLLATDTFQGMAAAKVVEDYLRSTGEAVATHPIAGLRVKSRAEFNHAIQALIKFMDQCIEEYRNEHWYVVFNVVGAFKALQGYVTVLGMVYADEIVYIFEGPEADLIRIPRLPMEINPTPAFEQDPVLFARMADGEVVPASRLEGTPETFWWADESGYAQLGPWGLLAWNQVRHELLSRELLKLPYLDYSPGFQRSFRDADAGDRVRLQETLVKVSGLLEKTNGQVAALRTHGSLQYEGLRGHEGISSFRLSRGLRVSCEHNAGLLRLRKFGTEEEVYRNP